MFRTKNALKIAVANSVRHITMFRSMIFKECSFFIRFSGEIPAEAREADNTRR